MANYFNILVEGDTSLEGLAAEVEQLLEVTGKHYRAEDDPYYVLYEARTEVIVRENTSFNEGGLNLEDYHFEIDVRGWGSGFQAVGDKDRWEDERAHFLFEQLKATGRYRLLLTRELERKEDEFTPQDYRQKSSEHARQAQTLPQAVSIYVATNRSLEDLAKELEGVLGVHAERHERPVLWYSLRDSQAIYQLMGNVYQDLFSGYAYGIDVKGRVYTVPGERRYWQYETARTLFNRLKETGQYGLLLSGDRKKLDSTP
jgi:hypothetical protein